MEFLKKIINPVELAKESPQPLTENMKKVLVKVPPVRIGKFIINAKYINLEVKGTADEFSDEDSSALVVEIMLTIEREGGELLQARVVPTAPVSTDNLLSGKNLNDSSISIYTATDGKVAKLENAEEEQFLRKLVAGYLSQNIDNIVQASALPDNEDEHLSPLSRFSSSDAY